MRAAKRMAGLLGFAPVVALAVAAALQPLAASAQQVLPAPLQVQPESDVPVAVQIVRWHMNDAVP